MDYWELIFIFYGFLSSIPRLHLVVPNRLYPLFLLAKLYYIEGDTARFLDMTDRVESFIPKVESVNTERLREEIVKLKEGCCVDVINAVSPASFSNNSSGYSKEKTGNRCGYSLNRGNS